MTRHLQDFYPTPRPHVESSLALLPCSLDGARIIDPGAGEGAWGTVIRARFPTAHIIGVELRNLPCPDSYSQWRGGCDYLNAPLTRPCDLIVGNPPFSMAEQFIRRSLELVAPHSYVLFLLRLGFLATQGRYDRLWTITPPRVVGVFADRPSFSGDRKTDQTEYAAFLWQRGWTGTTELRFLTTKPAVVDQRQGVLI